jgi:Beta-propeller repeat
VSGTCVDGGGGVLYSLTVSIGGAGTGSVTSTPAGLTCTTGSCTGKFAAGTEVALSASASVGSFLGWANDCNGTGTCSVKMSINRGVGALFGTPGKALWLSDFGGNKGSIGGQVLAIDSEDNLLVAGAFTGTIQIGNNTLVSAGKQDIAVAKLSAKTGVLTWVHQYGGAGDDSVSGIAVDGTNSVYVTGKYESPSIDFGGGALTSVGFRSGFVVKLGSNGAHAWSRALRSSGSAGDGAWGLGVAANSVGVSVTGYFTGSVDIGSTTLTSAGQTDILAAKYTLAGDVSWAKAFGSTSYDFGYGTAIDSSGNVIVAGSFSGSASFPNGTLDAGADRAVLLLKLAAADGRAVVSRRYGSTTLRSEAFAVAVDPADNIIVGGGFWGTGDFGGSTPLAATRQQDAFLAKYGPTGAHLWSKSYGGTGDGEAVAALSVNGGGEIAITGGFCGVLSFGGAMLSAASQCASTGDANHGDDMFAARFAGADGAHVLSTRAGGANHDTGTGIVLASDGRMFVSGTFQGFAEFGGTTATAAAAFPDNGGFVVGFPPL